MNENYKSLIQEMEYEEKEIFLVIGTTGEYEDERDWPVCAFESEEEALKHGANAQEVADKLFKEWQCRTFSTKMKPNPYDPYMDITYTGTQYYVTDIKLYRRK